VSRVPRRLRRLVLVVCCGLVAAPVLADDVPLAAGEDLTLVRAIALALAHHPARMAAAARAGAAGERTGEARAHLLPQVFGVTEYLRGTDNGIGDTAYLPALGVTRAPTQGRHVNQLTDTFDNYLAAVSAYQYLFDFGRTRGLVEQRDAEADAERARLRLVELDLVYQVSQSYFDLVAAKEIVKVYEKAVAQRGEHLRQAQVKAQAGLKPDIDVFTAQSDLARAQLRLVDARNASATAKAALDNAMGLGEHAPDYRQSDTLPSGEIPEQEGTYLERAFEQRPDLKMLLDEARATGAEMKQYRSDYLPSIGAVAGYNVRGQNATPGNNYYAGLVLTWPIFNGFLTDHQVEEARLRQDAVRHGIENLRQQIVLQVKRSFLDWQASLDRIHQAEATLAASRVELDLAEKRYESGLGSIIELTDAQRRYTEDGAEQVKALAGFSIARAALDRDVGCCLPDAEEDHGR
jgi:outer membrane protein